MSLSVRDARQRLNEAMKGTAGRWPPYLLFPSEPEAGRRDPLLVEIRDWEASMADGMLTGEDWAARYVAQTWPLDTVLKSLVMAAAHWYLRATTEKRPPRTTMDEMRQWINSTRSLAARLPYGGPIRQQLHVTATALERTIDWPAQYLVRVPGNVEIKKDADLRASLNVWALDQILRAVNETEPRYASMRQPGAEYLHVAPTAFWGAIFGCLEAAGLPYPPFGDYKEAQKRVSRLKTNIKDGQDRALMAAILSEHTRERCAQPPSEPRTH